MGPRLPVLTAVGVVAVGLVAPVSAAWLSNGTGTVAATAGTLGAPGTPVAGSVTTTTVPLSWTAAPALPTGTVQYHVQRRLGSDPWHDACGTTRATPQAATSCTDGGLSASTTYEYQVTSIFQAWRAAGGTGRATTAAVAAPAAPVLAASSDSGSSNSDRITRITTPTFTGTVTAGATVTLLANGSPVGTAVATSTGAYSVVVDAAKALTGSTSTAAHTVHQITVTQTVSGSTSAPSPATSVTVDTAAPGAPTITSPTAGTAINRKVIFTGTATENPGSVRVVVTGPSGGTATGPVASNNQWQTQQIVLARSSSYSAVATHVDTAGNESGGTTVTFTTDATN